ncbi:hypothetical protein NL676_003814 [Syzygium grande]|nr:hypothetical protein NL676_003814 [Syzygium grande]
MAPRPRNLAHGPKTLMGDLKIQRLGHGTLIPGPGTQTPGQETLRAQVMSRCLGFKSSLQGPESKAPGSWVYQQNRGSSF